MKIKFEIEQPQEVVMNSIPKNIQLDGVNVQPNLCFNNSHQVAQKNDDVEIVEGVIIHYYTDNKSATIHSHVWNMQNKIHFDVTKDLIWNNAIESEETKEIKYFPIVRYNASEYAIRDTWEFDKDVIENTNALKEILNN